MGEPVLRDTFNSNRWDYVHSYQVGKNVYQAVHVSLFFSDDVLESLQLRAGRQHARNADNARNAGAGTCERQRIRQPRKQSGHT
jgi:outer membrane protein assembly factor BamE (lipoprotein component of BamABCDE complex)